MPEHKTPQKKQRKDGGAQRLAGAQEQEGGAEEVAGNDAGPSALPRGSPVEPVQGEQARPATPLLRPLQPCRAELADSAVPPCLQTRRALSASCACGRR